MYMQVAEWLCSGCQSQRSGTGMAWDNVCMKAGMAWFLQLLGAEGCGSEQ